MVKKGFSLLEILIVVTLLVVLAVLLILIFNPQKQLDKARDSRRKNELVALNKVLEDWYNDKGCYPAPEEICYDDSGSLTCHICGNEPTSPSLEPYLSQVMCDPQQPAKKYTYVVEETECPKKYWIYSELNNTSDPIITELGCQNGCGPYGDISYNYGVASPGESVKQGTITAPTNTPTPTVQVVGGCSTFNPLYHISEFTHTCNICGTYEQCKNAYPTQLYYSDTICTISCIKD